MPNCAKHPTVTLVCTACLGEIGGKATTPRKQAASRANGKNGGRPRKVTSHTTG